MAWREEYNDIVRRLVDLTPGNKIYLDPTYGSDGGDGSIGAPVKTLECAYGIARAGRNDTILAVPGVTPITLTSSLNWTKSHTHLFGLGSPNFLGRIGRPGGTIIYTDTAAVDYTIHLTGDFCEFHNVVIQNGTTSGNATGANLSAMGIAGYGNYFKNVAFRGINTAAQIAAALTSSLDIMAGSGELMFENCQIGQNAFGGTRTHGGDWGSSGQGHLIFSAPSGTTPPSPQNGVFRNCLFLNRSSIAAVVMVWIESATSIDRMWMWDNCHFSNYDGNYNTLLTRVFARFEAIQCTNFILKNCTAQGFTYWTDTANGGQIAGAADRWLNNCTPISGTGGGLGMSAVGAAGAA